MRSQQVGLFKASSEKAAGDGPEEREGETEEKEEEGKQERLKLRHTGRVIYCNEDLWRQI